MINTVVKVIFIKRGLKPFSDKKFRNFNHAVRKRFFSLVANRTNDNLRLRGNHWLHGVRFSLREVTLMLGQI